MYEAISCASEDRRRTAQIVAEEDQLDRSPKQEKEPGLQSGKNRAEGKRRARSRWAFVSLIVPAIPLTQFEKPLSNERLFRVMRPRPGISYLDERLTIGLPSYYATFDRAAKRDL
jgi:hypothetical protein